MSNIIVSSNILSLILLYSICFPIILYAHSPHDDIQIVTISTSYAEDNTVFAVVRNNLLKSVDGGGRFDRVVRGLDYESQITDIATSRNDEHVLFLSTANDGIYRTHDKGVSWEKANAGLNNLDIRIIAVSPNSSNFLLAADNGGTLYKTKNGGKKWEAVLDGTNVAAIGYSLGSDRYVYLGDSEGNLYKSDDEAESWTKYSPPESIGAITAIVPDTDSAAPQTLYVSSSGKGVFSVKLFSTPVWESMNDGLPDRHVTSMVSTNHVSDEFSLFVSCHDEGVFAFSAAKRTWAPRTKGLISHNQAFVFGRPSFSNLEWSNSGSGLGTLFLAGFAGLFKSNDLGSSWDELNVLPLDIIVGLSISPSYSGDGTIVINTYLSGTYLTRDGGSTWDYTSSGISQARLSPGIARLYGIAFSPDYASDKTIFSSQENHLLRSIDGGKTWTKTPLTSSYFGFRRILSGIRDRISFEGRRHLFQKHRPSQILVSPDFRKDNMLYVASRSGSIFRSIDSGLSFSEFSRLPSSVQSLSLSPSFGIDRTMFAISGHKELYQSRDAGETWSRIDVGVGGSSWFLEFLPTPRSPYRGEVFLGTSRGLYRSSDNGKTWDLVKSTEGLNESSYVEGMAFSPDYANDGTLIVSIRGRGLFRSVNGGESFTDIGAELIENNRSLANYYNFPSPASTMMFSPTFSVDRTVVGSIGREIVVSADAGNTWSLLDFEPSPQEFSWFDFISNFVESYLALTIMLLTIFLVVGYFFVHVTFKRA